jgi:hypothetical protein
MGARTLMRARGEFVMIAALTRITIALLTLVFFALPHSFAFGADALQLGERMYREGILPSGAPMKAVTMGDVPVDGRMFACVSCHQRSGMGSLEGTVFTTSVYGAKLYAPLSKFDRVNKTMLQKNLPIWSGDELIRSAYTDSTLARSIRKGVNADGKRFDLVMPRYELNDTDMAILTEYLKSLSSRSVPGLTETTLRFATVVTDEVSPTDREAMLGPLRMAMDTWSRLRPTVMRAVRKGSYIDDETKKMFRKVSLDVWELKGQPESWPQQLEAYYAKAPVFALVGGISTRDWAPIHRFCEERRIPSLLPITPLPVISSSDWYTMYFSEGMYQEGESAARYLNSRRDLSSDARIVQIVSDEPRSQALAAGFRDTWKSSRHKPAEEMVVKQGSVPGDDQLAGLGIDQHTVILSWTVSDALPLLVKAASVHGAAVFLSSTLTGSSFMRIPDQDRSSVYLTYPRTLPAEAVGQRKSVELWLDQNRIPRTNIEIEAQTSAMLSVLSNAISMMAARNYYQRDFFFEIVDMMQANMLNKAVYPALSFGPGQRYASKGCYIVQLSSGPTPSLVQRSEWVTH